MRYVFGYNNLTTMHEGIKSIIGSNFVGRQRKRRGVNVIGRLRTDGEGGGLYQ